MTILTDGAPVRHEDDMITFSVPVAPTGQMRPRVVRRRGKGGQVVNVAIKHKRQETRESILAAYLAESAPERPWEGPVKLTLSLYYPIPKSWPQKKQSAALAGELLPVVKPDLSNCAKQIEDVMNGWFFRDDSQIVQTVQSKHYSDRPRWVVCLERV